MENVIYRVQLNGSNKLELSHYNDVDDQHLGITVFGEKVQLDGSLDESELDSLIKYLQDIKQSINKNKKITRSYEQR